MMPSGEMRDPASEPSGPWKARRVATRKVLVLLVVLGGPVGAAVQPQHDKFGLVIYSPWQIVVAMLLYGSVAVGGAFWLYCAVKSGWFAGRGYRGMSYVRTIVAISVVFIAFVVIVALIGQHLNG